MTIVLLSIVCLYVFTVFLVACLFVAVFTTFARFFFKYNLQPRVLYNPFCRLRHKALFFHNFYTFTKDLKGYGKIKNKRTGLCI